MRSPMRYAASVALVLLVLAVGQCAAQLGGVLGAVTGAVGDTVSLLTSSTYCNMQNTCPTKGDNKQWHYCMGGKASGGCRPTLFSTAECTKSCMCPMPHTPNGGWGGGGDKPTPTPAPVPYCNMQNTCPKGDNKQWHYCMGGKASGACSQTPFKATECAQYCMCPKTPSTGGQGGNYNNGNNGEHNGWDKDNKGNNNKGNNGEHNGWDKDNKGNNNEGNNGKGNGWDKDNKGNKDDKPGKGGEEPHVPACPSDYNLPTCRYGGSYHGCKPPCGYGNYYCRAGKYAHSCRPSSYGLWHQSECPDVCSCSK